MPLRFSQCRPPPFCFIFAISFLSFCWVSCSPGVRISKTQPIDRSAFVGSSSFKKSIESVVQAPWLDGNQVTTLVNGDAFYPAMLKAIRSAQKSITFETFAFVEGKAAYAFVEALSERARAGVRVHLVLDAFGSNTMGKNNIKRLRDAGAKVKFYHPFSIFHPIRSNTHDHRKLMVVDGKIGFTGGCGIGDAWMGNAHSSKHWRETHYRVTGPVVAQIQRAFIDNWVKTGELELAGPRYFPKLQPTGNTKAHAFISAPLDKKFTIPHLYRQVIASAKKSIIIENSYFLVDSPLMNEILLARKRGVHVELILPGKDIDAWLLRYLARYQYRKLLKAGVHIYEYQKSMLHCKVMVVDGIFSSVGSANFDPRSLYINDESNLNVLDVSFAKEQLRIIENDKRNCVRITRHPSHWNPLMLAPRAGAMLLFDQL